jgi:hypothetical protein
MILLEMFFKDELEDYFPLLYYLVTMLSYGMSAYIDLTSGVSKAFSRKAFFNADAHDAFVCLILGIADAQSAIFTVQLVARHVEALSGGKILPSHWCSAIKRVLQERAVRATFALLDPAILCELIVMLVIRHNFRTLIALVTFCVVGAMFRYMASSDHKKVWQGLYKFVATQAAQAQGQVRSFLMGATNLFDECASLSAEIWPTGPLMKIIQ